MYLGPHEVVEVARSWLYDEHNVNVRQTTFLELDCCQFYNERVVGFIHNDEE